MQRMIDKLVAAGWVEKSVRISEPKTTDPHAGRGNIKWTPLGRRRMASLLELIHEVERHSSPICNEELLWFKALAELSAFSSDSRF